MEQEIRSFTEIMIPQQTINSGCVQKLNGCQLPWPVETPCTLPNIPTFLGTFCCIPKIAIFAPRAAKCCVDTGPWCRFHCRKWSRNNLGFLWASDQECSSWRYSGKDHSRHAYSVILTCPLSVVWGHFQRPYASNCSSRPPNSPQLKKKTTTLYI